MDKPNLQQFHWKKKLWLEHRIRITSIISHQYYYWEVQHNGSIKITYKDIPNYEKIISITTYQYNSEKDKTSVIETLQGGENITQTHTNTKGRDPDTGYVEVISNLEYCRIKKSKE